MSVSQYIENFHSMTTRKELNKLREVFGTFSLLEQVEIVNTLNKEMS